MARPTKYNPEYNEQVYKLCLLGAKDSQLADFFDVQESTINNWKLKEPEFLESLKRGKLEADAVIAESLYHRAKGYSHPEDKIFNNGGEEMIVPTTKHYAPDTTAGIFWLKNRQPEMWRDKQDLNLGGQNDNPVQLEHAGLPVLMDRINSEVQQARADDDTEASSED